MNAKQIQIATVTGPLPSLGQFWEEQGGIRIGEMLGENGQPNYQLILPIDQRANLGDRAWGEYGKRIEGCNHVRDGLANTLAMAKAGNELALEILGIENDGFRDLYLPSQAEAYYCWTVAPDQFEKSWHWTSTQQSANYAWSQHFVHGAQGNHNKRYDFAVRLVRRVIHSVIK